MDFQEQRQNLVNIARRYLNCVIKSNQGLQRFYFDFFSITSLYVYLAHFYLRTKLSDYTMSAIVTIIILIITFVAIRFRFCLNDFTETANNHLFAGKCKRNINNLQSVFNIHVFETISASEKTKYGFCVLCNAVKPPRAHHCQICKRCILKKDHHCPWLGICIGYSNEREFYIFIILYFLYSVLTFQAFIIGIFYAIVPLSFVFFLLVLPFTFINILVLGFLIYKSTIKMLRNETALESFAIDQYINAGIIIPNVFLEGPLTECPRNSDRECLNPYNLGWRKNLQQIWGSDPWLWLGTSFIAQVDGYYFEKNTDQLQEYMF